MSCLFSRNLSLKEASAKAQIADKVQEFVSCTFIREAKHQIAEVSILTYSKRRHIEQAAHILYLRVCHRMFDNYNSVVNITSLDKIVIEKEFYLVEENTDPVPPWEFRRKNKK